MELYRETSDSLTLTIYVNGNLTNADSPPTLTVTKVDDDSVIVNAQTAVSVSTGKYQYTLSTAQNNAVGKYKAVWTYVISSVTSTRTEYYEVVVGYTTATEVRDYYPSLADKTNEEIYRFEKLARRIIDSFCNQRFDFEENTLKIVRGRNENVLYLPRRIYNIDTVEMDGLEDITTEVEILDDFWLAPDVELAPGFFIDIKRGLLEPSKFFRRSVDYYITGDWGWEGVPEDIKLATILLINDYFCDSTMLRQHGIYQSSMGDRQMTFRDDLWGTTGNYDVDILLSGYTDVKLGLI